MWLLGSHCVHTFFVQPRYLALFYEDAVLFGSVWNVGFRQHYGCRDVLSGLLYGSTGAPTRRHDDTDTAYPLPL